MNILELCGGLLLAVLVLLSGWFMFGKRSTPGSTKQRSIDEQIAASVLLPEFSRGAGYASSSACLDCHESEHASWSASFHRTMTQAATTESVSAPFDGVQLGSDRNSSLLAIRNGEFRVSMVDPDWMRQIDQSLGTNRTNSNAIPEVERQVVLTTGSHHYQVYWLAGAAGRESQLNMFPWIYHLEHERWLPRESAFLRPPEARRHFGQLWNESCINCHTTAARHGENRIHSSVAELGIACEACHGPGEEHIAFHKRLDGQLDPNAATQHPPITDSIVHPSKLTGSASSQICGQCHSLWGMHDSAEFRESGFAYRPGGALEPERIVGCLGHDQLDPKLLEYSFWGDGTVRVGGREYNGLLASPCHTQGEMSCLDCHSMHSYESTSDQLASDMRGNAACIGCHSNIGEAIAEHTHHAADSSGSLCYNCHMPHTSYALFKAIRSHRIDSPSAAVSARTGRPNACNLCHLDQTLAWTANHLDNWYGIERPQLESADHKSAAAVRWLLSGDAAQRVVTAWHFGWEPAQQASGADWQPPILAQALIDPYAAVRAVAFERIQKLPGVSDFEYDFIGSTNEQIASARNLINRWQTYFADSEESLSKAIPFTKDRRLNIPEIERLRSIRDDRPVFIAE